MGGVDALVAGKRGQGQRERLGIGGLQQAPPALPRTGADEAGDVQPLVMALDLARWVGTPAAPTPGAPPAATRAGAHPPPRGSPYADGWACLHRGERGGEPPFLNASCASGSARVSRGRGRWGVKPRRRIHSQPRCSLTGRPSRSPIQAATLRQGPDAAVGRRAAQRRPQLLLLRLRPRAAPRPGSRGGGRRCPPARPPGTVARPRGSSSPNSRCCGPPPRWTPRPPATTRSATGCARPGRPRADTVARARPRPGAGDNQGACHPHSLHPESDAAGDLNPCIPLEPTSRSRRKQQPRRQRGFPIFLFQIAGPLHQYPYQPPSRIRRQGTHTSL